MILSFDPVPRTSGVRNLLRVLQYLYNVSMLVNFNILFFIILKVIIIHVSSQTNSRVAELQRIPESEFCLLMDEDFLLDDLTLWHAQKMCMVKTQTCDCCCAVLTTQSSFQCH